MSDAERSGPGSRPVEPPPDAPGPALFLPARDGLRGILRVPGDKSISHRAALLGAVSSGPVRISGYLRSDDTLASLAAIRTLGVQAEWEGEELLIEGRGWEGLGEPVDVIDVANSGTLIRLLPGVVASLPFTCLFTGDASIRRRPMARILQPLAAMGVTVMGRAGDRLPPFAIRGGHLTGMTHRLPVASAQVKSCLLLAGLRAAGATTVIEPAPSRDHTERMIRFGGGQVERREVEQGAVALTVRPLETFSLPPVTVPGDFSSAAFFLVAATLVPGSEVLLENVGLNPSRTGLLEVLRRMGGQIEVEPGNTGPEPLGTIRARSASLEAADVGPAEVPNLIDELPLFLLAAARARGTSRLRGAAELRAKESDRLRSMATLLRSLGVTVREYPDGMDVEGRSTEWDGGEVQTGGDHRIAMVGAVAGLASRRGTSVDDPACMSVSFPRFYEAVRALGGAFSEQGAGSSSEAASGRGEPDR